MLICQMLFILIDFFKLNGCYNIEKGLFSSWLRGGNEDNVN